jgi:3',5'-cyclic AMP phosphodiesterase CpdA
MHLPDHPPTMSRPKPDGRRARARTALSLVTIALFLTVVVASGVLATLVRFGGYCSADFLPINTDVEAPPYVQDLTDTAATIMWRTPSETEGIVEFGEDPNLSSTVRGDTARVHAIRLTGLTANTTYVYRARSAGSWSERQTFRTPPDAGGAVTAVVVGDTGSGSESQEKLSRVMLRTNPDLVLHTGDVVYPRGGECHYEDKFYEPYRELIASVPVYPVLGNHDILTDNGEPYLTAFALPTESSGTERYYSFDFGPLHVAALDSELYYDDESVSAGKQKAWLKKDLQTTDRPWKIVIIHRPPFNSSPYHGADPRVLEDLVGIFEEEGVDVVFAGHEHVYERLKPVNDVTYFVTGGGGAELRGAGTSERTAVSALRFHLLSLQADSRRLRIEAVDIDGEVFDQVELLRPSQDSSSSPAPQQPEMALPPQLRPSPRLRGSQPQRRTELHQRQSWARDPLT